VIRSWCTPVLDEGSKPVDEEVDDELGREEHGKYEVEGIEYVAPVLGGRRVRSSQLVSNLRINHVEQKVLRRAGRVIVVKTN
jgi:hypothetical protein